MGVEGLSGNQKEKVLNLAKKFKSLFSDSPGKVTGFSHQIRMKEGEEFKNPPQYRVPEKLKEKLHEQIEDLAKQGIIEKCKVEAASPIVLVPKKDRTLRLCVDYRALNKVIKGDAYPMKNMTDLLARVSGAQYISCFDLKQGYYQIPLAKECRGLTAFNTGNGTYQFNVLPFGIKDAPASFQRFADVVLRDLPFALAYLDDFAVVSSTWEEHLRHIEQLFERCGGLNITFNAQKSQIGLREVKYLGHIAGSGQLKPDPEKLEAVQKILTPKTKKQVRSLLGLAGYYRQFLANFAKIAKPLTELTKKSAPIKVEWTADADEALQKLKEGLCAASALHAPDFNKPFIIATDASDDAIGACLSQENAEGQIIPIAWASAKLTPTQRNWAVIEGEAYAITWALDKWDSWIYGGKVTLDTDHNPLTYIRNCTPSNPKLVRWALALERYDLSVRCKKESANANADALSRLPNGS